MVIQFNKTYPTKELFQFNVKCFKTMLHINTLESCYCNSKKKKKKDTHNGANASVGLREMSA